MPNNRFSARLKADFSTTGILLIPVGTVINIICGQITGALKLPVYFDSIGTILSAILQGPFVGALTGLLSNVVNGIFDASYLPYSIVSILIGLAAGLLSRGGMFSKVWKVAVSGVILTAVATVSGTPITAYLYGGVTGSGSTFLTGLLMATGQNLLNAVAASVLISNLADKILSAFIAFAVVKLIPGRLLVRYSCGEGFSKKRKVQKGGGQAL